MSIGDISPPSFMLFDISKPKLSLVSSSAINFQLFLYGMLNKNASWISSCMLHLVNWPGNSLSLIAEVSETVGST